MIIVITGPTALGKTKSAIKVAQTLNAEIINGDAFQAYKELNIGTAKPTEKELSSVPHHLYSFIDPSHNYSIAEYQCNLRASIQELLVKNKNIVIVGGSGLYIRSALYDYEFLPSKEVDMSRYEKMTNSELHSHLKKIDPEQAEIIHENNRKRVLRAIEIYYSTGETKSALINKQEHRPLYDVRFFVRDLDRDELYERINKRVDEMFKEGLVDEVKSLMKKYDTSLHCFQAIGYKELIDCLNNNGDLEDAKELIKQHTRNYAKRQMTYIRHQFPVTFYKNDEELLKEIQNG